MAKPKPKCDTCQRGESYFEGCSHPDCPKRRPQTARAIGQPDGTPGRDCIACGAYNGGLRRMPTNRDE